MNGTGIDIFWRNLKTVPTSFKASLVRQGAPVTDRGRAQAVFSNVFLHLHATRTHVRTLRFSTTMAMGMATLSFFIILVVTGILLMVYYKPSVASAYDSINDIRFVVPTGRLLRNAHRWSAHAMVVVVFLHMARVFYTAAYKSPREFNWMLGIALLATTLGLSFTGYLLPWDQLAYWAVTIGANIAGSPREITDALGVTGYFDPGGFIREAVLGAHFVGEEALLRFYTLHIMVLPIAMLVLIGSHFWRIRKDGGLARPASADSARPENFDETGVSLKTYGIMAVVPSRTPATNLEVENTVPSWPGVFRLEAAIGMVVLLVVLLLSLFLEAPLQEHANPEVPENPAKAPWYFLGVQELVSYSAFAGGMVIPGIVILGLALIPFLDREKEDPGIWFSRGRGRRVALVSAIYGITISVAILAFTVRFGWLRDWFPQIPQLVITLFNPGTVFVLACAGWSLLLLHRTNSTRMAAVGLFTCFFVCFILLTYFAEVHRGPNWGFYWSQADWPATGH